MYVCMHVSMYVCMKSENKSYLAGMGGRVAIRSSIFRSVVKKKGCMVRPYSYLRNLIKLGLQRIYDCELQLPKAVYIQIFIDIICYYELQFKKKVYTASL